MKEIDESASQNLNEPAVAYAVPSMQQPSQNWNDEIESYLQLVPDEDKATVLEVVKRFAVNTPPVRVSDEEWEIMERQREAFLAGTAKTYTREESFEILRNKQKRDEFLNRLK